jgi:valyl-tRNA synthetase
MLCVVGASADWSKERFTLEPTMSESVTEAFVRLYERGLVYKGDYLVSGTHHDYDLPMLNHYF